MRKYKVSPAYWFVLPAMLFFAALAVYPSGYVAFLAFFAGSKGMAIAPHFTNFANFTAILEENPIFGDILLHTLYYAGIATLLHLILGLCIALILNSFPLNRTFIHTTRTLFLIPWAISPTVVAIMFRLLLHPQVGPIAILLRSTGSDVLFGPLGDPKYALISVTLTNVWLFTPFYLLMILSAMQSIDPLLYEAAVVDGANGLQQIFFITIPSIKNSLLTLGIFDFVTTAGYFDLTWIMTQGGPINSSEVLATLIYRTAFQGFEFGVAAAIGMILFVITITVSILVLRSMDKE